jgi:hypothetical protein
MIDSRVCSTGPTYHDTGLQPENCISGVFMEQIAKADGDAALEDASTRR